MKQYRIDYFKIDGQDYMSSDLQECVKYDYTPMNQRYVNLAELLDVLNGMEEKTKEIYTLIHSLTKPIPGSD